MDMLTKNPARTAQYVSKSPAYAEVNTVYVYCEQDAAVRMPAQKRVVEGLRGAGYEIKETTLPSGHFPFLSMPERCLDAILEVA